MSFQVIKKDLNSKARVGVLTTAHGEVETPAYVIVGTHGAIKTLSPEDIASTKTQMIISNTYHLWRDLGENLDNFPGLHAYVGWNGTLMTDSGGFQVFSLGFAREHGVSKIANIFPDESQTPALPQENLVRITDEGVYFKDEHGEHFLNAKLSIKLQEKIGADIILAFDECTSPLNDYEYTKRALGRTHEWAKICLNARTRKDQLLYGIVQGGAYEDLRSESAKFIGSLPFDGFAIGGSLGKSREDMFKVIDWVVPYLPEEKPRHLLGIGRIGDIFEAVERGIDSFDCVVPTREARHASLWTRAGRFQVTRGRYNSSKDPIDHECACPTCAKTITRGMLYEMFKSKALEAARLATTHNVWFFNHLMESIRKSIKEGGLKKLKDEFLDSGDLSYN